MILVQPESDPATLYLLPCYSLTHNLTPRRFSACNRLRHHNIYIQIIFYQFHPSSFHSNQHSNLYLSFLIFLPHYNLLPADHCLAFVHEVSCPTVRRHTSTLPVLCNSILRLCPWSKNLRRNKWTTLHVLRNGCLNFTCLATQQPLNDFSVSGCSPCPSQLR